MWHRGVGLALWGWTECLELDWEPGRQLEFLDSDFVGHCTVIPVVKEGREGGRRKREGGREEGGGGREREEGRSCTCEEMQKQ